MSLLECIQKEFSTCNFVPSCKTCLWDRPANTSKKEPNQLDYYCPSYRSLSELKVKGIHFKSTDSSRHSLKKRKPYSVLDIEFIPGYFSSQLKLPTLKARSRRWSRSRIFFGFGIFFVAQDCSYQEQVCSWTQATKPPLWSCLFEFSLLFFVFRGEMNNGAVFLSLVCFYFLFNLWLGSKTFFLTVWVWKMWGILVWI